MAGPRLRIVDGLLALDYPNGRPERFEIPAELFEGIVAELNTYRRIGLAHRAAKAVNGTPATQVLEFVAGDVVPSAPSD